MLRTGFLDTLRAAGVTPEAVDVVICTHLHVDHVGWNTMLVDGKWVFLHVPYPMSFYPKNLDGRIDDANGGWKGRGIWSVYSGRSQPQSSRKPASPVVRSA